MSVLLIQMSLNVLIFAHYNCVVDTVLGIYSVECNIINHAGL